MHLTTSNNVYVCSREHSRTSYQPRVQELTPLELSIHRVSWLKDSPRTEFFYFPSGNYLWSYLISYISLCTLYKDRNMSEKFGLNFISWIILYFLLSSLKTTSTSTSSTNFLASTNILLNSKSLLTLFKYS